MFTSQFGWKWNFIFSVYLDVRCLCPGLGHFLLLIMKVQLEKNPMYFCNDNLINAFNF